MKTKIIKWNSTSDPPNHGRQVYVRRIHGFVGLDNYSNGWIRYTDITNWHELLDASDFKNEPLPKI